jgi:hypothetical protein
MIFLPARSFLRCAGILCVVAATLRAAPAEQATNPTPAFTAPKVSAGTASLMPTPNRLIVSAFSGENLTRKIWLMPGTGPSLVGWVVGQPVTADGLYALPDSAVVVNSNKSDFISVEPGKPALLTIQFQLGCVHSGEYTSDVFLYSTNASSLVQVIVRVKDRPLGPGLTLLGGIVLSFGMARYREAGRQHDLLVLQASKLEQILATDPGFLTATQFKDAIADALNQIRTQLDQERYADATNEMTVAAKMVDNWLVYKSTWLDLFGQLNHWRLQAASSNDPAVPNLLNEAEKAARAAAASGTPTALGAAIQALAGAVSKRVTAGASQLVSGQQLIFKPGEIRKARADTKAYLMLLYLAIIALFFIVGYKELYDAKSVFGANGLMDYLTLILWGFGVETTTRTSLASVVKNRGIPGFN